MEMENKLRMLKIANHIISIIFMGFMTFLWHILDDAALFVTICVPSTIIFGLSQGINMLLANKLVESSQNNLAENN